MPNGAGAAETDPTPTGVYCGTVWKRSAGLCLGAALTATALPGLAEVEVLHGATLRGGDPPTDVVVVRGSQVGGALPDPAEPGLEPRPFLPLRTTKQTGREPQLTIVITPAARKAETRRVYPTWTHGRRSGHRARPGRGHRGDPAVRVAPRESARPRRSR